MQYNGTLRGAFEIFYVVLPFELEDIISEVEYPMKLKHVRTHKVFPITFQEKVTFSMPTCCIYLYIDSRHRRLSGE